MENNVVEIILPFGLVMSNVYFLFAMWMYPAGARPTNFSLCEIAMQGMLLSNNHAYNYYVKASFGNFAEDKIRETM
jgi:hypothetical protein